MAPVSNLHETLSRDGFVVIPDFLSASSLATLRSAAEMVIAFALDGKWPFLRTMPKQFPPWSSDPSNGIWGIEHILHPDLPGHEVFAANYFSDELIAVVTQIMECPEDQLVMELYNMLVGTTQDFELRWHRDDILDTATIAEEEARLCRDSNQMRDYAHAQWNIALYDDECLVVVPGSHRRARTEAERAAAPNAPHLPDMKVVELKAGSAVFYDHNILHRGVYAGGKKRATLHGAVGMLGTEQERARVILQHGVGDWIRRSDFSGLKQHAARAEGMRKRLIAMDDAREGKDVGFSLQE